MTEQVEAVRPPGRILLATDLTSQCDRALDRALQLAKEWRAELQIVHAVNVEPPSVPAGVNPLDYLQRHPPARNEVLRLMRRDLGTDELGVTVHVDEDLAPAPAILAVAEREKCDLIVLGETRQRLFGPIIEGTVEQVVRKSPVSVLMVRDRPRHPYRHLLVGTDFTDEAQQALVFAAQLFGDASITLMHAYSMPYSSLLDSTPESHGWAARDMEKLREQVEAARLSPDRKASIRTTVEAGPPNAMLRRYILEKGADLTVIGAHPRGVLFDAFVGNSRRIVDAIPSDILMVRAAVPSPAPFAPTET